MVVFDGRTLSLVFRQQRHKPPQVLERPRELVLVCSPFRSNVNFSRIVRVASCSGVRHVIVAGRPKLDPNIARIDQQQLVIERHRSLVPVLKTLKQQDYHLVGLEQTNDSVSLYDFPFPRRTALVVGNERQGITDEVLDQLDAVIEIPVYGLPYSYNVATSVAMALYEYCRQYPLG